MRKRLILATMAVAVITCIVLGALAMLPPRPGVTKANFDRVHEGMALKEVEAIFGQPPLSDHPFRQHEFWIGEDRTRVIVKFDDGLVSEKTLLPSRETIADKIRRWLHLP